MCRSKRILISHSACVGGWIGDRNCLLQASQVPRISPSSRFTMRRLRAGIRSNLLFRFTTAIAVIGEPLKKIHLQALRARTSKNPIIRGKRCARTSCRSIVHATGRSLRRTCHRQRNRGGDLRPASFHDKFVLLLTTEIGRLTSRQSQSQKYSAGAALVPFLPEGG